MPGKTDLKPIARVLRRQQTDAERKLWRHLRNRQCGGYKFRRQVNIGRYIADLVCLDAKLIIEIDGGHHLQQECSDSIRSRDLELRGFRLLRFWNHEILNDTVLVLEAIYRALNDPLIPGPSRQMLPALLYLLHPCSRPGGRRE